MKKLPAIKAVDQDVTDRYAIYQGDSCELIRAVPGDSVHFGVHSPPFEGLYKFSGSDRDLSNSEGKTFWQHYQFLILEMLRITMPSAWPEMVESFTTCLWLADYIVAFRKPGDNPEPVSGALKRYVGEGEGPDYAKFTTDNDSRNWFSIEVWQRYASPVWMDIRQTRTLQYLTARDGNDEAHISPLQLDVIERCIDLWSNPDDIVFTPFLGIGSEVWAAVQSGRRGLGFELKDKYFRQARINMTREIAAVSADALTALEPREGEEEADDAPETAEDMVNELEPAS
ncbi:DNA methyltransferase [Mesorhizobium ciceri]|uniref:DNA methyltransferase n=1 Tax=Mesorhizobium TaxID=68287 RepID=UPI00047CB728|nr:DNA methyltransferase [Mesorhizobium ciceri]